MTTQMNCYYYKWASRKTGKVILVNFGWASSFRSIAEKVDPRKITCTEISKAGFDDLRSKGF